MSFEHLSDQCQTYTVKMSCCPSGSWGALDQSYEEYVPKGKVEKKGDMDIYIAGVENGKSGKCIIWNYDIFGFNGGRSKMWCDLLASERFLVIMPDFYRGIFHDKTVPGLPEFLKEQTQWSKLKQDVENIVLPMAKSLGGNSFGCIGTCWGGYMVIRESSYPEFKAGISMHPSHSPISALLGEVEADLLKEVQCQQLFMPAGNDHENVKPGGLGASVLGNKLRIIEFPDMIHGWTTRGDMSIEAVNRDVKKAFSDALSFFKQHLRNVIFIYAI